MRRADDIRQREQLVLRRRFRFVDVDTGACDMAGFQCCHQVLFHDQPAARAIDDAHARLGLGEVFRVDDVAGLVGQRRVQRDEIGAGEQFVQLDLFNAQFLRTGFGQERIESHHMHFQADGAGRDNRTDIAAADDAERLSGDLDSHEAVLFPLAGAGGCVGFRQLPRDSEHQRDGVFCRGDRIAERRVHDDDTAARSRRNIDIIDADTGATDDLELFGGGNQLFRDLGGRTDRQTVIIADDFEKLFLVLAKIRQIVDFHAAILKNLDGSGRKLIGYENARCH